MQSCIKYIEAKSKNRRIAIYMLMDENNHIGFLVETKRLVDFKAREITQTTTSYGVETFTMLYEFFGLMARDPIVKKTINPHLGFPKYSAKTNLKH